MLLCRIIYMRRSNRRVEVFYSSARSFHVDENILVSMFHVYSVTGIHSNRNYKYPYEIIVLYVYVF